MWTVIVILLVLWLLGLLGHIGGGLVHLLLVVCLLVWLADRFSNRNIS